MGCDSLSSIDLVDGVGIGAKRLYALELLRNEKMALPPLLIPPPASLTSLLDEQRMQSCVNDCNGISITNRLSSFSTSINRHGTLDGRYNFTSSMSVPVSANRSANVELLALYDPP